MRILRRSKRWPEDDQELVRQYHISGDMEVLGTLYDRYIELVYGVCMKYLKNPEDSQDAVMSIFEELVTKLRKHEVGNFRSWLHVLTRNYCLQQLRKSSKTLTKDSDQVIMHLYDDVHPDDEYLMQHRENGLKECIEQLPPQQKRSVELFYFETRSYAEIAQIMSVKKENVRSYIQNGRRNLKNCMLNKDVGRR